MNFWRISLVFMALLVVRAPGATREANHKDTKGLCRSLLLPHEPGQLRTRGRRVEVGEGARLANLARCAEEPAHGRAIERGGDAHAAHARVSQLRQRKRLAPDRDH